MAVNRKQRRAQAKRMQKAEAVSEPVTALAAETTERATVLMRDGRGEEAVALLDDALIREPDSLALLKLSGLLHYRSKRFGLARDRYARAAALAPQDASVANNLGLSLKALGEADAAIAAYRLAIAANPQHAKAHHNMALVLLERGDDAQAEAALRKALALEPTYARAACQLARLLRGQLRNKDAAAVLQDALRADPESNEVLAELGHTLDVLRYLERSEQAWRRLISRQPGEIAWHRALANALVGQGRMAEAASSFQRCLEIAPDAADVIASLGDLRKGQGRLAEAEALIRRALELRPDLISAHSNLLVVLNYACEDDARLLGEHRAWAQRHSDGVAPLPQRAVRAHGGARLRVGYVSPDFRQHSAAYFIEPLMAAHDRNAFEIHCYSGVTREDEFTQRCRELSDGWVSTLGLADEALAARIAADGIDILVDLCGHFGGHRLGAFALRPAPVQVTWMGYPATTGMRQMDYRISDAIADPPGETDPWHSERLARLPGGFLCYRPYEEAPDVASAPCLRSRRVTFGSFNNLAKVTDQVVACWSCLLDRVPGSRLLLKDRGFADEETRQDWSARFARHGVGHDRLELHARVENLKGHLDFYRNVDIALDPFPYNGTTTTCEAFWMGVPVVSLAGSRHAARVGASLLAQVGLDDLVAQDEEGYLAIAAGLAGDPVRLETMRRGMRARMAASPLCDNADFARRIEEAYRTMAAQAGD